MFKTLTEFTGVNTAQQGFIASAIGIFGSVITNLYGGWSAPLELLLWLIVVDYISGLVASIVEGTGLNSAVGFRGLLKKGFIMLIVLICHKVDAALEIDTVMIGAIYFYLANELISITENAGRMKLPVPDQLTNIISVLKGKGEKNE